MGVKDLVSGGPIQPKLICVFYELSRLRSVSTKPFCLQVLTDLLNVPGSRGLLLKIIIIIKLYLYSTFHAKECSSKCFIHWSVILCFIASTL